jgi:hypothetical protein
VPPTSMQIAVRGGEIVATLISIVMLYRLVLAPWRRVLGDRSDSPVSGLGAAVDPRLALRIVTAGCAVGQLGIGSR